jgi:Tfp pilus assembly protein PilF
MARERPLTGVGLDAFPLAFGQHRPAAFWQREWNVTPTKAHNEAVHILATQGFTGAAAALVFVAGLAVAFRRAWRRAAGDDRLLVLAAGGGTVALLVTSQFGFIVAACGSLLMTFAGLLAHRGAADPQPQAFPRPSFAVRLVQAGVAAAVLAGMWFGVVRPFRADIYTRSAAQLRSDDPARALPLNEQAVALDAGRALLWMELADTARLTALLADDPGARRRHARRVREAADEAVRLVPADAALHARRGQLLLELAAAKLAEPAEALAAFDAALARDPENACLRLGAARAAWACGRTDLAREQIRRGSALDPRQADLHATFGALALSEGHVEEAEAHLAAASRCDWHGHEDGFFNALALWGYCLLRLNRPVGAEGHLRLVVERRPDWPGPRLALGQALAVQGRPGAAEEFQRVIELAPDHPFAHEARRWLRK